VTLPRWLGLGLGLTLVTEVARGVDLDPSSAVISIAPTAFIDDGLGFRNNHS